MNTRLLGPALPPTRGCRAWGPALATLWLAVTPGTAWAQHGSRSHAHAAPPARASSSGTAERAHFHAPPYYLFPRGRLGIGLYAAYPPGYPYYYFAPGGYLDPSPGSFWLAYPYGSMMLSPQTQAALPPTRGSHAWGPALPPTLPLVPPLPIGAVSVAITPDTAAIFVDGVYVGTAGDFSATALPLILAAGHHHFEARAPGYETATFDLDVLPGEMTPYQQPLLAARAPGFPP